MTVILMHCQTCHGPIRRKAIKNRNHFFRGLLHRTKYDWQFLLYMVAYNCNEIEKHERTPSDNKIIHDNSLRPRIRNLAAPPGESRWIIRYIADDGLCLCICSSCKNVTSYTKPELHNVLHCLQRRTKPRPQSTWKKMSRNLYKWFLGDRL